MQAQIKYVATCHCTWCERDQEGVVAGFASGILAKGSPLCFRCLQQALRVDHKQSHATQDAAAAAKAS